MPSLRGHFLLAAPSLQDPQFLHTVVFMVKHDVEGAIGVIINRPLEVTVAQALGDDVETAKAVESLLHQGGPCKGPMMVLHGTRAADASDEVIPGVMITHQRDAIEAIMTREQDTIRYIIGYAGWATDQLEREMAEGSWVVLPASASDVFADTTTELWGRLMGKASLMRFLPPEQIPDDPGLN